MNSLLFFFKIVKLINIQKNKNMLKNTNKSSGQVSKLLLVLAVIVLVAVIITFLIMKMVERPPAPPKPGPTPGPVLPVYEDQLGNIRFVFESALNKGDVLKASEVTSGQYVSSDQKDLFIDNPGAEFIQVKVGAQDKGTIHTEQNAWDIENIVDSQNREFVPLTGYTVNPWLPNPNLCGAVLQPAFDPSPCTKIYEVSKESTGLKIRVETGKDNTAGNLSSGKTDSFLIDLIVK